MNWNNAGLTRLLRQKSSHGIAGTVDLKMSAENHDSFDLAILSERHNASVTLARAYSLVKR